MTSLQSVVAFFMAVFMANAALCCDGYGLQELAQAASSHECCAGEPNTPPGGHCGGEVCEATQENISISNDLLSVRVPAFSVESTIEFIIASQTAPERPFDLEGNPRQGPMPTPAPLRTHQAVCVYLL